MADIKKLNMNDLKKQITEKRSELRDFRFGGAGSRTRNVREGRFLRRDIARLMTELRTREIEGTDKRA